ncbi:hypothetical protein N7462_005870 [Penicillium macrosclerotiorum]|uniref:uncharacterized protein n=1 Tax=Penicillium macrosclerotiorum TaxID=303699 RepID=UPI0025499959|nr:uncharacterized protein N7462_005870 [Penicillium macrosclerotiorum]KAJ5682705.1 hypothetical protein N7462_005870 [Penicillium macrosclerotiorum]
MFYTRSEIPFQRARNTVSGAIISKKSMMEKLGRTTHFEIQSINERDNQQLRSSGVFQTPSKLVSDNLIHTFLKYSFPVFPIFNWTEFYAKYNNGATSPLLLNAIYMVATFHASESVLSDAGFSSRYIAGLTFYRKAKALYDSNHEFDGVTTVQATILMSNWWGGPMEQKDTWYWLGVSSSLAQSLGMHRSIG